MPSHTYYIEVDNGFLDSNIANIRRKAIEHLWENRNESEMVVYTNATKKRVVGKVIYTGSWPIFLWKPNKGHSVPLRKDGNTRKKN